MKSVFHRIHIILQNEFNLTIRYSMKLKSTNRVELRLISLNLRTKPTLYGDWLIPSATQFVVNQVILD